MSNKKPKIRFPTIRYPVTLSTHSIIRMKQRAGLKTKEKRKMFVKRAADKGLLISQIPHVEEFNSFLTYFARIIRNAKRKDKFSSVYFYKDYFILISIYGVILTVIKIDSEFKGIYNRIYEVINQINEKHIVLNTGDSK